MLSARIAWLARAVWSFAPRAGLVAPPPPRPEGVSALVRAAGDEEWIEPCLLSVAALADEILLLDHGVAPATRRRLDGLVPRLGSRLRVLDCAGADLPDVANRGLEEARYRWAFLWDADLVARTAGPADIARLKGFLGRLDPGRYHLVYVRTTELAGDLHHHFPDLAERYDPHVLTAGGPARYVWRSHRMTPDRAPLAYRPLRHDPAHFVIRYDTLLAPKLYRVHRWREPAAVHVNVKSARRTLLRHFWAEWLAAGAAEPLEAYARRRVRQAWGLDDLEAAAARFMEEYCRPLVRVDPAVGGGYPDALRPYLARARYRVRYRDGRVVGRDEGQPAAAARGEG
jgi:hypothetical protein